MNRRIRRMISPLVVFCCPLLAQIASGGTVTVVTHGLDPWGLGGPLDDMGDALFTYWDAQPGGAVEYQFTPPFGLTALQGTAGNANKIIVFDWASESDRWQGGYDEAAGDTLFTMLKAWGFLNSDYLHLIGHSRGTIVASEAAQRILHHGYSVNQLTFLDTEPGPTPFNKAGEAQAWGGVDFVDNYYGDGDWWELTLLKGEPVDGAYDRHLSTTHTGVHEWYTATINDPNATDGYYWRTNAQSRPTATGSPTPVIPPPDVVNGNFEYGVLEDIYGNDIEWKATKIAGWDYHGGSGTGHVDSDEDNRYNLELDTGDTWKTHNWLYVPENADKLVFDVTVENLSLNDYFALVMDRIDGYSYEYWPLSLKERTDWITYEVLIQESPLKDFAGSVCRLSFSLNGGAITSQVSIDGIHFEYLPGPSSLTSLRSGNWNNAATWTGPDASTIPDASTDVVVQGGHAVKVHIAGQAAHILEVEDGSVSVSGELSDDIGYIGYNSGVTGGVTVTGGGSTWTNNSYLCVARSGTGTLDIYNGGRVTNTDGYIGSQSKSDGTVTIDGATSKWDNSEHLFIGYHGAGKLTIKNGGNVSNTNGWFGYATDGSGTVEIQDTGSTWESTGDLSLGHLSHNGIGYLTISDGGSVFVGDAARTGGTGGYLIVSDADSSGAAGGHLYVYNGSKLNHGGNAVVGDEDGEYGWVRVHGTDSSWTNSGVLNVGLFGTGTLNVSGGGHVENTIGYVGRSDGSEGTVTVSDSGSTWESTSYLCVASKGTGMLEITAGGHVKNTDGYIASQSGSDGTVTVSGADSTWTNSGLLFVGSQGDGTLTITHGGLVSVTGTLTIDYNGGDDSFINMTTGGMLALFGEADDSLDAFLDLIGGTDAINYWDDLITDWAPVMGATPWIDYTLDYIDDVGNELNGYTILSVRTIIEADFDEDGDVDADDFAAWQSGFGITMDATYADGDSDVDGDVDGNDFLRWQTQFGLGTCPESTAVPEPATGLMLMLGVAVVFAGCRINVSKLRY